MAVTKGVTVLFVPLKRIEGDIVKHSLLARWHGYDSVLGDGTGGLASVSFNLANAIGLFGPDAMFDLRFYGINGGGGLTPGAMATIECNSWERTIEDTGLRHAWYHSHDASYLWGQYFPNFLGLFKYRFTNYTTNSSVIIRVANINGLTVNMMAGGYVWDERFLD